MTIETTVLDFKLSNTFEEYEAHMKAPEQQAMFNEMGVKIFFLGKSLDDPTSATVTVYYTHLTLPTNREV